MYQKQITFFRGNPSVEPQILGQADDPSAVVGVSKYISSSSVLPALRFVNTIISSKHYLKSFVVVVGGWEGLTGRPFTRLESRA